MTFLHLADPHIGKLVNGFSMLDEQRHAFSQILDYITEYAPSAVLIAGDVYDRAVPGVEAVRVFDDFLTALAERDVAVLLISGNHDSPERLHFASRLLAGRRLYLAGAFEGAVREVTLTDGCGPVHFWLLPFVKPATLRGLAEFETYGEAFTAALATAEIDFSRRNVLLAHQFFVNRHGAPLCSDSEINPVGGLDAIDSAPLERFDYAALGHLHAAQKMGAETVRYAGSPVKYSFSECRHEKSVTLVELREKGDVTVTALPLTPLRDMREIKGDLAALTGPAAPAGNREDYLRVTLTDEDEPLDAMAKLRALYPHVMALDFDNARTRRDVAGVDVAAAAQLETLSLYDLFSEFFLDINGAAMSAAQAKIARALLGE